MGLVIFRKSDNQIMMSVIQYPLHDQEIFENFIENGNHNSDDYGKIEIKEKDIPLAMQKEISVVNGEIKFGKDREAGKTTPATPSEAAELRAQNEALQLALAETIEKQEQDKLQNQLAIAELAEIVETLLATKEA